FREAGGEDPVLLIHDAWSRDAVMRKLAPRMPENVIPFEVEEVGSVGLDAWLAVLAYGARAVAVVVTAQAPRRMVAEVEAQVVFGRAVLEGMGYAAESLNVVNSAQAATDADGWWANLPP